MKDITDRRMRKTREALYAALHRQILQKGYDAVTVQDIIDEADVGRSTFYAHFSGKEELLRLGFERLRQQLASERAPSQPQDESDDVLAPTLSLFEHAWEHRSLYRAMIGGRGGLVAQREFKAVISESIRDSLKGNFAEDGYRREMLVEFITGAFIGVLQAWFDKLPKLTPEEVNMNFRCPAIAAIRSSMDILD